MILNVSFNIYKINYIIETLFVNRSLCFFVAKNLHSRIFDVNFIKRSF